MDDVAERQGMWKRVFFFNWSSMQLSLSRVRGLGLYDEYIQRRHSTLELSPLPSVHYAPLIPDLNKKNTL
jgi:hypothetical protein